ncbi:hypothetical protein FisN_29Hu116 [Fistulifera solaris]|jgi:hypothetical protein|uniref:Uncharacterized protein n=1 Tax=Fistulifera solaris TaxID=1519565 RepID=A0A1Z5K637_FISSO|nr:hypothetical protein FisN_29Hu116 [Fistulifera solaris]|eukprot:GAX21676.1 hypothetical protein FisN_29Hu116 [Fistulifera solaris]
MTVFDEQGRETEKIPLHTITEKAALHQLMKEKGFVQMSPEEMAAAKGQGGSLRKLGFSNWFAEETKDSIGEPSYKSMFGLYGMALLSLGVIMAARRRRLKRRR